MRCRPGRRGDGAQEDLDDRDRRIFSWARLGSIQRPPACEGCARGCGWLRLAAIPPVQATASPRLKPAETRCWFQFGSKALTGARGLTLRSMSVLMSSNFDIKWFQVAVTHERAALEARERAVAAPDGSQEMAEAFDDELQATMVVVAATAFAINALYVKVDELLDEAVRSRAKGLTGRILETFKNALDLGKRGAEWQKSIPELFRLRGELVHFRSEYYESQPHPTGKSNVTMESSVYTVERAKWAVDLALEVLTVAYRSPRAKHKALVTWAESAAHVPGWLEDLRRGKPE